MSRFAIAVALFVLLVVPAVAATAVGKVARIQGSASGAVEGKTAALKASDAIFQDEAIKTGAGARLEIVFSDGTTLTIGEKSSVRIDRFVFNPGRAGNVIRLAVVGPFRFASGKLGTTGATRSVVTPFATIGIRGTNFWGGPIDGKFGVFLVEGAISVTTPTGTTLLDRPGSGTSVGSIGAAPGGVTMWGAAKIRRAMATTTFR